MEDDLAKWQSIWQKQKSKPMQLNKIIGRLNSLEQKAKTQRMTLLLLFSILILVAIVRPFEVLEQKFYLFAYILTLAGIIVKLLPDLKGKYSFISNEAEFNNQKFVAKLEERLKFDVKRLVIFLILVTLGLNSTLIGLYEKGTIFNFDFTPDNRVIIHLCTIIIFIAGYSVNRKKLMKKQKEISSLIAELKG